LPTRPLGYFIKSALRATSCFGARNHQCDAGLWCGEPSHHNPQKLAPPQTQRNSIAPQRPRSLPR
jgi:hypothetical protein